MGLPWLALAEFAVFGFAISDWRLTLASFWLTSPWLTRFSVIWLTCLAKWLTSLAAILANLLLWRRF